MTNADIYFSVQDAPYKKTRGTITIAQNKATVGFTLEKNHIDVSVCDGIIQICNRGELSYLMNFEKNEFVCPIITPFGTTDVSVKVKKKDFSIDKNTVFVHCEYFIENECHNFKLRGKIDENNV